jgi:hypothetical protein
MTSPTQFCCEVDSSETRSTGDQVSSHKQLFSFRQRPRGALNNIEPAFINS